MMSRGSAAIFFLVVIAVAGAVAWWVTQGVPGIISPLGTHNPASDPDVKVDRASGSVPLGVTFYLKRDIGTIQTIAFGDGTSSSVSDFVCGLTYCLRLHTYLNPGTYTATFENAAGGSLYTITITVAGP